MLCIECILEGNHKEHKIQNNDAVIGIKKAADIERENLRKASVELEIHQMDLN